MKHAFLLSLVAASILQANTLEPMEILSGAITQDELRASDAVEIFTAEQIATSGATDLYGFLNANSSVIAMPSYGNPFSQRIDMHGYGMASGYQNIVVTLNGRRLNNIDTSAQLLASISPAMIERIEIIKGGGSVVAGDGANAGVINITTKRTAANSLSLYGGLYDTQDATLSLGYGDEHFSASGVFEAYHNGGTRDIDLSDTRDAQKLANGSVDFSWMPSEALELYLSSQFHRSNIHYGGSMSLEEYEEDPAQAGSGYGFGPAPSHQKFASESIGGGIDYTLMQTWNVKAEYFKEKKRSEFVEYNARYDYDYDTFGASVGYEGDAVELTLGFDGFSGERANSGEQTSKDNAALYVMSRFNLGSSTIKAGVRGEKVTYTHKGSETLDDDHSLWGAELGYNYRLNTTQSLYLNVARSYEAPDIDRFFTKNFMTNTVNFNGFVDPMTATTVTIGYNRFDADNKFKMSLYYSALKDEIYYYADPSYIASANTNIDSSHKYGLDLFDAWAMNDTLAFTLNYNYVKAVIDDEVQNGEDFSDNDLPGVPEHTFKVGMELTPNTKTTLLLSHIWRSATYAADDFGNSFAQKQEIYNSTDVAINYHETNYTLFAKINNLFNEANGLWIHDDAIYPINFTTTAVAGVSLNF